MGWSFKKRVLGVVTASSVFAAISVGMLLWPQHVGAQSLNLETLLLQGSVTIAGRQAEDGWYITAKVRDAKGDVVYTSPASITGLASPGRYTGLSVGPVSGQKGATVEFWLNDQVMATSVTIYGPIKEDGTYCSSCGWGLPIIRSVDLRFDSRPIPTPTPTFTPTSTPRLVLPDLFAGNVIMGSNVPADGTPIYAMVGSYVTEVVFVRDGKYTLVLNPQTESAIGKNVEFYVYDQPALQEGRFVGGQFNDSFNLFFKDAATAPIAPTATPAATATPEATRTPVPTVAPTPTVTPTVTPTAIVSNVTLSDEDIYRTSESGGCLSNAGGPAGLGILGVFAIPFALRFRQKLRLG